MRGTKLREESLKTREQILQAATQLFAEKGFANVSIREICQEANVSLPLVYYYFGDKAGLFEAVVRQSVTMQDFLSALEEKIRRHTDPLEQLRAFIRLYLSAFPKDRLSVGFYMRDSAKIDEVGSKQLESGFEQIRSLCQRIVAAGSERGLFRRTDTKKAADCLMGMLNSFVFRGIHFQEAYDPEEVGAYIFEFFLHAVSVANLT